MKFFLPLALAFASADAATRVAVIELGSTGSVRRTNSALEETSAEGVASFWSSLHGFGRKLQHSGMTVVPDLFSRPDSGVVLSLTNVDLDAMPNVQGLMTQTSKGVVGHMQVDGQACEKMMLDVKNTQQVEQLSLVSSFESLALESGISGMKMEVTSDKANDIDLQVASLIQKANEDARSSGKTVVLHLVVEEDEGAARRHRLARRLEQQGQNEGGQNAEQDGGDNNGNDDDYFGNHYYYNTAGEQVNKYKTMFQIQYFNVVLWTSLGLAGALFFSLYLFVGMPLMADTLLFGQQAKTPMED